MEEVVPIAESYNAVYFNAIDLSIQFLAHHIYLTIFISLPGGLVSQSQFSFFCVFAGLVFRKFPPLSVREDPDVEPPSLGFTSVLVLRWPHRKSPFFFGTPVWDGPNCLPQIPQNK